MNFFKKSYIFFLIIAIFYSTLLEYKFGIYKARMIFTALFFGTLIFIVAYYYTNEKKLYAPKYYKYLFFYSIVLFAISASLIWDNAYSVNYYIAIFIAMSVVIINKELFYKYILITFIVQVLLQTYEYLTESFLYEFTVERYGLSAVLSLENMYLLRVKGLFEGPLIASAFSIYMAYLFRYNPWVIVLAIYSTLLANTRLGILTTVIILILHTIFAKKFKNKFMLLFGLIFIVLAIYIGYYYVLPEFMDEKSLARMNEVSNTDSQSNAKRIYFWLSGINFYLDYDLKNLLFGCSQCFGKVYFNSAESDWLMIFLELGFFGFLVYFIPILFLLFKFFKKKNYYVFSLLLLLTLDIFLYRQISSAYTTMLHWIVIFSFIDEIKGNKIALSFNELFQRKPYG